MSHSTPVTLEAELWEHYRQAQENTWHGPSAGTAATKPQPSAANEPVLMKWSFSSYRLVDHVPFNWCLATDHHTETKRRRSLSHFWLEAINDITFTIARLQHSGACRWGWQTSRHAPSEYLVLHKHTLRVYEHTLLVQTHPTVTTMPYGHSLGNRAKLCTMTAHSDLLTETYMQTAWEMMNLRERESGFESEQAWKWENL